MNIMSNTLEITDKIKIQVGDIIIEKPMKEGFYDVTLSQTEEREFKRLHMLRHYSINGADKKSTLLLFSPSSFIITFNSNEESIENVLNGKTTIPYTFYRNLTDLISAKNFDKIEEVANSFERDSKIYATFESFKEWAKINLPVEAEFENLLESLYKNKDKVLFESERRANYFKNYLQTSVVNNHTLGCMKLIDNNGIVLYVNEYFVYKLSFYLKNNECVGLTIEKFENFLSED